MGWHGNGTVWLRESIEMVVSYHGCHALKLYALFCACVCLCVWSSCLDSLEALFHTGTLGACTQTLLRRQVLSNHTATRTSCAFPTRKNVSLCRLSLPVKHNTNHIKIQTSPWQQERMKARFKSQPGWSDALPIYQIDLRHHPRLSRWGWSGSFVQTEHVTQSRVIKETMKGGENDASTSNLKAALKSVSPSPCRDPPRRSASH